MGFTASQRCPLPSTTTSSGSPYGAETRRTSPRPWSPTSRALVLHELTELLPSRIPPHRTPPVPKARAVWMCDPQGVALRRRHRREGRLPCDHAAEDAPRCDGRRRQPGAARESREASPLPRASPTCQTPRSDPGHSTVRAPAAHPRGRQGHNQVKRARDRDGKAVRIRLCVQGGTRGASPEEVAGERHPIQYPPTEVRDGAPPGAAVPG